MAGDDGHTAALKPPEVGSVWNVDVFHEIHRLELEGPGPGRLGRALDLAVDGLRLGQRFTLEGDEIAAEPRADTWVRAESLLRGPTSPVVLHRPHGRPPRLFDGSFGLLGIRGAMPIGWTLQVERLLGGGPRAEADLKPEVSALSRFLDIFHHRLMVARYRSWADARPTLCFDEGGADPFSRALAAWAGAQSTREPDAAGEDVLRARGPASAAALRGLLAEWLGAPAHVEELVGEWLALAPGEHLALGSDPSTSTVGFGAMLGQRSWERQGRCRVYLGPLDAPTFEALLDVEGTLATRLAELISRQVGPAFRWDAWIRRPKPAPAPRAAGQGFMRLGRDAALGAESEAVALEDWDDRILDVQGQLVRGPLPQERFLGWTPSRRLRDVKDAVEDALEIAAAGAPPDDAERADSFPAGCSLERALCAATWAALLERPSLVSLAGELSDEALRWFLDLDHVDLRVPFAALDERLEQASREQRAYVRSYVRTYVGAVLPRLRELRVLRGQTDGVLRRLTRSLD